MPRESLLERATDVTDFLASPLERYVVGRGWLAFSRKTFSGFVLWGRLDVEVARSVAALLHARCEQPPHPSILDLHLVDHFDLEVLDVRKTYRELLFKELRSSVTRLALIHPPGILAMTVVGLHSLLNVKPPPFPEGFFADTAEALRWLEREDESELMQWLHEIPAAEAGLHPFLSQVRQLLDDRRPDAPPIGQAARHMGLSQRSLQRRLADAGTSYQTEVGRARLRHAQSLLLMPDANVTEVAFKVGCASPQHLSTLFKKLTGTSPTEWRDRARRPE